MQNDTKAEIVRLDERINGIVALREERKEVVRAEISRLDERINGQDRLTEEREKALRAAFASSEKAVDKAEGAQQRVNVAQNEFRLALSDSSKAQSEATKLFATRNELESADKRIQMIERESVNRRELDALADQVKAIQLTQSGGAGRSLGVGSVQEIIFRLAPLLIALVALYLAWKR